MAAWRPEERVGFGGMLASDQLIEDLRRSYDDMAAQRETDDVSAWKMEERDRFLDLLQQEGRQTLLEIGAGPGKFAQFFRDSGLTVVCTDLSAEMVKLCRAKGLTAHVMEFLDLDFPDGSFDAVFALNCLLHVPEGDLPGVLEQIRGVLKPAGLFYLGLYGGKEYEGVWPGDDYEPQRYFRFQTDDQLLQAVAPFFDLVSFLRIALEGEDDFHFQSMVLRKPAGPATR